jgi:hypothetical protein
VFKKLNSKIIGAVQNTRSLFYLRKLADGRYDSIKTEIPYYSQFASPELISDILDKKVQAEDDPNWRKFGFKTTDEYAFWSWRACGIMCLKMIIDTLNKTEQKSVADLLQEAVSLGGYIAHDKDGKLVDKGWFYKPLVLLANKYGISGKVKSTLSINTTCAEIIKGRLVVASVNPSVIRSDRDAKEPDKAGGHLVLVHGFKWEGGKCKGFYIHNPSGRTRETQSNAFIPIERFISAFACRGMTFWK